MVKISELTMPIQRERYLVTLVILEPVFPRRDVPEPPMKPSVSRGAKLIDRHIAKEVVPGITVSHYFPLPHYYLPGGANYLLLSPLASDNRRRLPAFTPLRSNEERKRKNPQNQGAD